MLFNSYEFLIFFPVVVLIYYLLPKKMRYIWLLVTSYYYYMCWDAKYALLIASSTVITYFSGILLERVQRKELPSELLQARKKWVVFGSFAINIGILFFFKYFEWVLDNISLLSGHSLALPFSIVLPVGISFYTFQALSYTMDVYRGEIKPEKNFLRYALFVSFFPQLVAGPIERSKNLLGQLDCDKPLNYENARSGLQLMLWGFFEKIVIADKVAIMVNTVFNNVTNYSGSTILFAMILFAIQIYCDFGGYSHIAIGAARVFNITLMDNFKQPYFSTSIKEFWRRWHISLSTWFRDYLYIPMGGSRCSKTRKYFNLFITFLVSGLWHGASWHFVIWGCLHGIYQILGEMTKKMRMKLPKLLHMKTDCFSFKLGQIIINFLLVDFAWMFFRANNLGDAFLICKKLLTGMNPSELISDTFYSLGLNAQEWYYVLTAIMILLLVDLLHEKQISLSKIFAKQNLLFRWAVYYAAIVGIIISLIQTFGVSAGNFIYFQF